MKSLNHGLAAQMVNDMLLSRHIVAAFIVKKEK